LSPWYTFRGRLITKEGHQVINAATAHMPCYPYVNV